MIGRLRGYILEKQPPLVLLEANGVGYEVHMPMTCFYELPELGQEAIVFTQFVVREDAQLLYGFNDKQERALLEREEITSLVKLPGVGKKTAERLVVEMKDRFKGLNGDLFNNSSEITLPATSAQTAEVDAEAEAASALVALGYKPQEASRMVSKIAKPGADCETLIRDALRAAL